MSSNSHMLTACSREKKEKERPVVARLDGGDHEVNILRVGAVAARGTSTGAVVGREGGRGAGGVYYRGVYYRRSLKDCDWQEQEHET